MYFSQLIPVSDNYLLLMIGADKTTNNFTFVDTKYVAQSSNTAKGHTILFLLPSGWLIGLLLLVMLYANTVVELLPDC